MSPLLFFSPQLGSDNERLTSRFFALSSFIFFPTRSHLVLPTFTFFPIKAKGCDLDIFLAVPDILSLLHGSINHRTVPWCKRRWVWPVRRPSSWPITFCCCVHSCTAQKLQSEPLSSPFLASELVLTLSSVTSTFLSFTSFICCVTGCVSSLRMKVLKQHEVNVGVNWLFVSAQVLLHGYLLVHFYFTRQLH